MPNRSEGDIRFTLHELGNGELVLLGIDKWDGDKWVSQPLDTAGFDGAVNAENIDPVGFDSPAIATNGPDKGTIPADQFFETYFNLTDLIGLEPSCPPAFGTLNFRTATGESAEVTGDNLKDYLVAHGVTDAFRSRLDAPQQAPPPRGREPTVARKALPVKENRPFGHYARTHCDERPPEQLRGPFATCSCDYFW